MREETVKIARILIDRRNAIAHCDVFKIKQNLNNTDYAFQLRLVSKGNSNVYNFVTPAMISEHSVDIDLQQELTYAFQRIFDKFSKRYDAIQLELDNLKD